jgi:hypothetical protein
MTQRISGDAMAIAASQGFAAKTCSLPETPASRRGPLSTDSSQMYAPAPAREGSSRSFDPQFTLRRSWVAAVRAWNCAVAHAKGLGRLPGKAGWPTADWSGFADLRCGAKTRAGHPCKRRDLYASGRCALHGGLSTGPRTAEGKARSALNGARPVLPPAHNSEHNKTATARNATSGEAVAYPHRTPRGPDES